MAATDASLPAAAQRVQAALDALGLSSRVVELTVAARTSQQAADALGIQVGCIAKSLVFRSEATGAAVLVIAAGDRRVNEQRVALALGEAIGRADPAFVREHSGFAIGGVAPIAHVRPMKTFFDLSLERFDEVWAAGGTPHCVFPIAPNDLARICGGQRIAID